MIAAHPTNVKSTPTTTHDHQHHHHRQTDTMYSHPLATSFAVSEDLNEVDFGGAEGLPQMVSAAILAPSYLAWSNGRLDERAGVSGESGVMLRRRGEAAAGALLASCREGRQVGGSLCSGVFRVFLGWGELCVLYWIDGVNQLTS